MIRQKKIQQKFTFESEIKKFIGPNALNGSPIGNNTFQKKTKNL